jgi:hypothetical protein
MSDSAKERERGAPPEAASDPSAEALARLSDEEAEAFASKLRPSWEQVRRPEPTGPSEEALRLLRAGEPIPLTKPRSTPPPAMEATVAPAVPVRPAPVPAVPAAFATAEVASAATREPTDVIPRGVRSASAAEDSVPPAFARKRSSALPAIAIVLALAVIGLGAWVLRGSMDEEQSASTAAEPATPAAPQVAEAPNVADEPSAAEQRSADAPVAAAAAEPTAAREPQPAAEPAPPATVSLSVRTVPEGAEIFVDGVRRRNPFEGDFPTGGNHRVEARMAGYESDAVRVVLDRPRRVMLELKSKAPARATKKTAKAKRAVRTKKPAAKKSGAGEPFVSDNPY